MALKKKSALQVLSQRGAKNKREKKEGFGGGD